MQHPLLSKASVHQADFRGASHHNGIKRSNRRGKPSPALFNRQALQPTDKPLRIFATLFFVFMCCGVHTYIMPSAAKIRHCFTDTAHPNPSISEDLTITKSYIVPQACLVEIGTSG